MAESDALSRLIRLSPLSLSNTSQSLNNTYSVHTTCSPGRTEEGMASSNSSSTTNSSELETNVIVGAVFMVFINLIAIASNTLILTAIFRTPFLRNSLANVFVINLCVTDLLCAVLVLPMSVVSFLVDKWPFGEKTCTVHAFINALLTFSSILCLLAVSVERFFSIGKPMLYVIHVTPCRTYIIVALIWVYSLLFAGIPLASVDFSTHLKTTTFCTFTWSKDENIDTYPMIVFAFCFLCPGLGLIIMYVCVFRVAHTTRRRIHPLPGASSVTTKQNRSKVKFTDPPSTISQLSNGINLQTDNNRKKATGQLKAEKTLLLLIGMFLLSWAPYFTFNFYGALYNLPQSTNIQVICIWLGYAACAVNPFLYGWRNRNIRDELTKLLTSLNCCTKDNRSDEDAIDFIGSAEDFLQFLERTTCSTRLTTQTSCVNKGSLESGQSTSQHVEHYL